MEERYVTVTCENIDREHMCCAISDKKHQKGVELKKHWLKERIPEGHVFRKLDARGKVFIEYTPLETAWVPIVGQNYLYIHCLWVSGSYAGRGHGTALLDSCIEDAKEQHKSGICILSSTTKKPFLSDKAFLLGHGFEVVDRAGDGYELLARSFDGSLPRFADGAKSMQIASPELTIYYSAQCPYITFCIDEVQAYCKQESIALHLIKVETLQQAKELPCVFNNYAVFYHKRFLTLQLLNSKSLQKLLEANRGKDDHGR